MKIKFAAGLVAVGFGQDGPGMAMPKGDFRPGILGGERGEALLGGIQVLKSLQFEVLSVGVRDQNVIDGVAREASFSPHGALPPAG